MVLKKFYILFILLFSQLNLLAQFGLENDLVDIQIFQSSQQVHENSELKIALKISISESWHINSNKPNEDFLIATEIQLQSDKFNFALIKFPEAEDIEFSFSDLPVSVYEGEIIIGAVIHIPEGIQEGEYEIPIILTYQACNDATCMPPTDVEKTITIEVVDNSASITEINTEIFSELDLSYTNYEIAESDEDYLTNVLESNGLILSLFFVFIGGLALNLTPCVYPLIPITIGFFGGQSEGKTSKLFLMGLFYVLGMALTYSIVGVVTALSGAVFGTLLQNPLVILFIVLVFIVLSLSMFGVYEFKLPDSLVAKAGGSKSGLFGAFFMGLTMGVVAAPCIGPFVIGLVTYVAAKGDPFYGFILFFVMAVGLGLPYLILALFSGKIKSLPRAGFWMDAVKHIFGFILLGMAIYFAEPLLPKSVVK
ncbi:MAG: sulfite exporter TauE/SafE family protein, partial [Melioribacteraceae bacterium]|nr:sulfite exporter TauE/SafE family protein [Melioribacteraceae bacterium]